MDEQEYTQLCKLIVDCTPDEIENRVMSNHGKLWLAQQIQDYKQGGLIKQLMFKYGESWRARQIVDNAQYAMILTEFDGKIRLFNPAAMLLFHYTVNQVVGRPLSLVLPVNECQSFWTYFDDMISIGESQYEPKFRPIKARTKDGFVLMEYRIEPIRLGILSIFREFSSDQ